MGGEAVNGDLIRQARVAMARSLALSSKFQVGAALMDKENRIYLGCNIETITSNLGICAERVALFKALSEGVKEFESIAIVASSGRICPPCGVCRQLLWEFAPGLHVIMADKGGRTVVKQMRDLLPEPFDRSSLKGSANNEK